MLVRIEDAIKERMSFHCAKTLPSSSFFPCSSLAVGWGSGATEFPYLITPEAALRAAFDPSYVSLSSFLTNANPPSGSLENQDLCLVFVNSDAGEGFISHDGVAGDRPDLYPQKGGDKLVQNVVRRCGSGSGKTVVVVHSVGPVVVERWVDMDGVKGLLFAHLPGQESGSSLVRCLNSLRNIYSWHLPRLMYFSAMRTPAEDSHIPSARVFKTTGKAVKFSPSRTASSHSRTLTRASISITDTSTKSVLFVCRLSHL